MSADVKVALGKIADAIQSTRPDCPTVEVIRDGGGIKLLIADPNYTNQTLRIKCRGIGNRACPLCPVKNRSIVVRLGVEN